MEFEGVEYSRDGKGYYRCPWQCVDPAFSKHGRKFKGEDRFRKHLETCAARPRVVPEWIPPAPGVRRRFGVCPDCGGTIWEMESVWWMFDKIVCMECSDEYQEQGVGHLDCAGLEFSEFSLEG